jgi:hypothetical protein
MISRKHIVLLAAGVFLLAALPFARTVGHGLVNLDDFQYTVARAQLTSAPLSTALRWLLTSQDDAVWIPTCSIAGSGARRHGRFTRPTSSSTA